jgi:hypothetical protein
LTGFTGLNSVAFNRAGSKKHTPPVQRKYPEFHLCSRIVVRAMAANIGTKCPIEKCPVFFCTNEFPLFAD